MNKKIYVHDIPGRLRIRTEAMKKNERAAAAVQSLLLPIPGVASVVVNTVTGSITVTYDAAQLNSAFLSGVLHWHGYVDAQAKEGRQPSAPVQPSLGRTLLNIAASKVGKMIVNWTVERALTAAIAALL